MKKTTILLIVLLLVLFSTIQAQKVVYVEPGIGSLNDSITVNGEATYVLEAGGWYGLNASIQTTSSISIIGETPAEGQMPAIIQNGSTSAGETFGNMFVITADLTLKNVFIVNSDLNDGLGTGVIFQVASAKVVIDSVTVDPVGENYFLMVYGDDVSTYITNSLFMRQGNTLSINDGGLLWNAGNQWDTLYVENNTFVDVGTAWLLAASQPDYDREIFHWINHNSFLFGKAHMYLLYYPEELYFTNNMCWMFDTYLFQSGGEENWDAETNRYIGFFDPDTLVADTSSDGSPIFETLPSDRKMYVRYNSNYRTQGVWDLIAADKENDIDSYLKPFIFPRSYADSSRATKMFYDDEAFPYFTVGDNIEDLTGEITGNDPNFSDDKIYALTDSAEAWAIVDWEYKRGEDVPESSEWPDYFYSVDGNNGDPSTWPRFDGAYTNSQLLTASIEELPLGDLNWFPEAKEVWEENQETIMNHIMSLDTTTISITDVKTTDDDIIPQRYELSQNYPNPFNPSTTIQYSITKKGMVTLKVYNLLGQEVTTLVNKMQNAGSYSINFDASNLASGMYIYKLSAGDVSLAKKLMLLK